MIPTSTLLAGAAFVSLAAVNVVAMLEASRPACSTELKRRLTTFHRIGGYLFVIFLCIMIWVMSPRLVGTGLSKVPVYIVVHVALAVVLVLLIGLKILVVRRYRYLQSLRMRLGLTILLTSFLLVALPVLSQAFRSGSVVEIGFVAAFAAAITLCLLTGLFAVKRLVKKQAPANDAQLSGNLQAVRKPFMTLVLTEMQQQTHDTKTLRFLLSRGARIAAKPGQFLNFQWIVDGRRVQRSYTISSSPVHSAYVEITPKRIENGCVSNFLHEQAELGLTVEASGPHGKFFFDETVHRSIVLIAAGRGITPMISIIRYINDRRLSTPVTLLYCVRTREDIIFQAELKRFTKSMSNFEYAITLSQPDDAWDGNKGRLTQEYVFGHVTDRDRPKYFLCGPSGFMDNARQILTSLGVETSRITQESFGERPGPQKTDQAPEEVLRTVEFLRSQRTVANIAGCTLLEIAEANGIEIPFDCRQGQCGTCATHVVRGDVQMETDTGLTARQKEAGFVLACVSRARDDIVVAA